MGLFNLLEGNIAVSLFGTTYDVALNWIGTLIKYLIIGVGSVGVGIILFSLILKIVVLPFDVYQRVAMRKQNQKMAENKEKMEKLQKQYANDKQMYNQKVMEMYKEGGISIFSSCLPMILSMVIFFVAIGAFNTYSQYSNIENYNIMVNAYNEKMNEYVVDMDEEYDAEFVTRIDKNAQGEDVSVNYIVATQDGKPILFETKYPEAQSDEETYKTYLQTVEHKDKFYYIDSAKAQVVIATETGKTYEAYLQEQRDLYDQANANVQNPTPFSEETVIKNYFVSQAQDAVVVSYEVEVSKNTGFLWIKNIWATDATYKHPVLSFSEFSSSMSKESFEVDNGDKVVKVKLKDMTSYTDVYQELAYERVTAKLDKQKSASNGYFILIALSIGSILLQQIVSMRSQKEQQKYSSVDGQAGSQQKMMLFMMTGIFAIFSFLYSSAFTIYMIMSNLLSLASTLIINKAVDASARKKEQRALQEKYNNRFPRTADTNKKKKK